MSIDTSTAEAPGAINSSPADIKFSTADPSFEARLIDAIAPISQHFLAAALHTLFNSGLFDHLAQAGPSVEFGTLAEELELQPERLEAFLRYLANEGVVEVASGSVRLTGKAHDYAEFRSWYTFLIGGYSSTLLQLGDGLRRGADPCTRNGRYVGYGSCEIARFDGIPVTRKLLAAGGVRAEEVLDLGCGNALYLAEFCQEVDGVRAWGAEPDAGGYDEARQLVRERGLEDRIRLANRSATDFLTNPPAQCRPDVVLFGFVLQEILAQDSEEAVVALLRRVVDSFPQINIVVIEVANEIDNPSIMRHGLAKGFWNPYFLLHPFTEQRLERKAYWDALFEKAGLVTAAFVTTDPEVDSTGLVLGYLLRGPGHPRS